MPAGRDKDTVRQSSVVDAVRNADLAPGLDSLRLRRDQAELERIAGVTDPAPHGPTNRRS